MSKDLALIPRESALVVFTTRGGMDPILEKVRAEIDAFKPDITSAKGRTALASFARKVASFEAELLRLRNEAAARLRREERIAAEAAERARKDAEAKAEREHADKLKAEKEEADRREADKAHKAKINRAAFAAFVAGGMSDESAKLAVSLIASRKIPAVSILY
jgi:hypothetical protein